MTTPTSAQHTYLIEVRRLLLQLNIDLLATIKSAWRTEQEL
jgi:hypothetical protein